MKTLAVIPLAIQREDSSATRHAHGDTLVQQLRYTGKRHVRDTTEVLLHR